MLAYEQMIICIDDWSLDMLLLWSLYLLKNLTTVPWRHPSRLVQASLVRELYGRPYCSQHVH